MKLKHSICCGLDVHKKVIVAIIVTTNSDWIPEYNQKSFLTINSDIQKFHNWLIENNCYHVCMESTGKYWIPIFNYFKNDIDVYLTHPKYVKAIKSKKQPYFAVKYRQIKKRRGHKKAIITIARMMMVCIYHMVSEKKPFNPTGYEELMNPQNHVEHVVLNETSALAFLVAQGYDISCLEKISQNPTKSLA